MFSYEFHFFSEEVKLFSVSPKSLFPNYKVKQGINTIQLRIPKCVFNQKNYRLEVHASTIGEWIWQPNMNAPSIALVFKDFDEFDPFYKYNKEGLINPLVSFEFME